jgi:hypothetical protein
MLDPRVREAVLGYQSGRFDLETAAQLLLQVRRDTGCLELHAPPGTGDAQRRLVERFQELARELRS